MLILFILSLIFSSNVHNTTFVSYPHDRAIFDKGLETTLEIDDDDVYLYKLQREGVTKSMLYTLPYRPAKKV
jgi:hypothetical protein